ncbi:MAG: BrnT family toxin [Roseiarcus sp.]
MTKLLLSRIVMNDEKFQWDERQAASNIVEHGVTFDAARDVFKDPFALDWLDESEDYGEDRYAIIGMSENRLLYVAYTMRGEAIRIISARLAEPQDRRRYHEDNET